MKLLLIIFLLFGVEGSQKLNFTWNKIKEKKFEIHFLQDGEEVKPKKGILKLKKKEFIIQFTLFDQEGVFMSSSFERDYFDLSLKDEIKDYPYLTSKVYAESEFNESKRLWVHKEYFGYYSYSPDRDWYRFDKEVKIDGTKVIGTKTIQNIMDDNLEKEVKVEKIEKDIYLFFLATGEWKYGNPPPEKRQILKIKIEWIN